jgi:hypothetical protein
MTDTPLLTNDINKPDKVVDRLYNNHLEFVSKRADEFYTKISLRIDAASNNGKSRYSIFFPYRRECDIPKITIPVDLIIKSETTKEIWKALKLKFIQDGLKVEKHNLIPNGNRENHGKLGFIAVLKWNRPSSKQDKCIVS